MGVAKVPSAVERRRIFALRSKTLINADADLPPPRPSCFRTLCVVGSVAVGFIRLPGALPTPTPAATTTTTTTATVTATAAAATAALAVAAATDANPFIRRDDTAGREAAASRGKRR